MLPPKVIGMIPLLHYSAISNNKMRPVTIPLGIVTGLIANSLTTMIAYNIKKSK